MTRARMAIGGVLAAALLAGTVLATPAQAQTAGPPAAVEAAVRAAAATELAINADAVQILRSESVTWRDSCLGAGGPAESCLLALTPGYVVWVSAGGDALRYHVSATGDSVRLAETGIAASTVADAELPDGVIADDTSPFADADLPSNGGFAILVSGEATTPELLIQDLEIVGCAPLSLARTEAGKWQIYIPGAPASVNEASGFPGQIPASSGFIVRCAVPTA